jgi:hypothetical protein
MTVCAAKTVHTSLGKVNDKVNLVIDNESGISTNGRSGTNNSSPRRIDLSSIQGSVRYKTFLLFIPAALFLGFRPKVH